MDDRVPLEQSQDQESPKEQAPADPQPQGDFGGFADDPEYNQLADFLDVDFSTRQDVGVAKKLSFLQDWALDMVHGDKSSVHSVLKSLERNLGTRDRGMALVNKLYQWTRLQSQRRKITNEMEAYYE